MTRWHDDDDALTHGVIPVMLDGDGSRPSGVILQVRGQTYRLDDRVREIRPGVWEAYGPPGVIFREGEAGWFAAYAPGRA